ncbi:DUF6152 family protein [Hyphomicrobium sp.]|uniref:DUF6152 family protein n=1 Tax=Hyphomicrobium sp. TaxID=82 RepID=UPI0025BE6C34|nr:DUF6152 family protein [Hyphomicrobium sp.]MCC7253138.1 hypothetical protein [Hyphomicrobium sp.]
MKNTSKRKGFYGLAGLLVAAVALLSTAPAVAHHGWSWAVDEQTELTGTIQEISMAPPHPTLRVADLDGTVWQVDLGNPGQTARSGFTGESAKPGDAVTVLGNRHRDETKKHMKAVRITIGGINYDMYPDRIRAK